MISSFKAIFIAIRFKTLIASIAPVVLSSALSFHYGAFNFIIFSFILLSALFIQIGTNFANDVYDYLKGADTKDRLGPTRAVQAQLISISQMKILTFIAFLLAVICGFPLVIKGGYPILIIGLIGIISGYLYTAGPYPLGYNGWGDFFVFCFFGPIAVCGTYYLYNESISVASIILGIILGNLSTSLLCINNIRDVNTDVKAGKRTLAVRISPDFVRSLFSILLLSSYLLNIYLVYLLSLSTIALILFLLLIFPCLVMIVNVYKLGEDDLNSLLGKVSLYIMIYSGLFFISLII
ncbi:MAG: 1,4-dihydroxy-2-naphthoate octaprenyltransferase [Candidatus Marinimicrobia bacterium]|nr:1,4-dihydroxy-2-naphthoate octaprenyltransferase [Candidatus Neomarinimicrobiota bacterium]|tara:strand:- start:9818 stop:10699 length:882 start_codon:yes stop_codon:yes gene_type:complete